MIPLIKRLENQTVMVMCFMKMQSAEDQLELYFQRRFVVIFTSIEENVRIFSVYMFQVSKLQSP